MNPPPPMLPASGWTTARANPTATAASTALPPCRSMSRPTSLAMGLPETTIALVPRATVAVSDGVQARSGAPASRRCSAGRWRRRARRAGRERAAIGEGARNPRESIGEGGSCPGSSTGSNLAAGWLLANSFPLRCVADDFLDARLTERRNPRSATIDTASALEIVDLIGAEDATVPAAVARARVEIARTIDLIEAAFRAGGRLLYVGAGTSGRLGVLDAAECPPTFGTPPEMVVGIIAGGLPALIRSIEGAEDDVNAGIGEMDARKVGPRRRRRGHRRQRDHAVRPCGARRGRRRSARARRWSPAPSRRHCSGKPATCASRSWSAPKIVTGSTRMKSGTATKLVLNTLTTGAMIRLGKVYGNLMVDLRAWNDKLVDRSHRILMETTGLHREAARPCSTRPTEVSRRPSSWPAGA